MLNSHSRLIAASILSASFIMVGCSSDSKPVEAPPAQPAPAKIETAKVTSGNGITNFRDGLIAGQQQIDLTLASLAALTDPQQTDLRGAYNTYCDQLARMRETSQSLKVEADAMRSSRDVYFANWEDKVSDIDNPTIRASAEARRKRLQSAHEEIITSSSAAKDAYVPFMKDLEDVRKYLAGDLSKSSIADLKDAVKSVQSNGAIVRSKIGAVIQTLNRVEAGA